MLSGVTGDPPGFQSDLANEQSITGSERAVQIETDYAPAYGAKANSLSYLYYLASLPNDQIIPPWREAISQALSLDEAIALAQTFLK